MFQPRAICWMFILLILKLLSAMFSVARSSKLQENFLQY